LPSNKIDVVQKDTFFSCFDFKKNDGDTAKIDNGVFNNRVDVVNKKQFEKFSRLFTVLRKQREMKSDTILKNLLFESTMIKNKMKNIEKDKY